MSNPALTVHHLQRSQSERILWLLEELSIPYNLEIHKRDPLAAPASLRAVHPQGTAPVLVDGDLVLSESMAISTYILNKHASSEARDSLIVGPDDPAYADYLYWLYFVLTTLQSSGSIVMFAYLDQTFSTDPNQTFPEDTSIKKIGRPRFQKNLAMVEERLSKGSFIVGDRLTLVDFMVLWVLTGARFFCPWSLKPYPNLLAYVQRITSRPAYLCARDKGDHGLPIMNEAEPGDKKPWF